MKKGLTKDDIEDLRVRIPSRDPIAERAGKPVHHGGIEAAEEAALPWLRDRRRGRRRKA